MDNTNETIDDIVNDLLDDVNTSIKYTEEALKQKTKKQDEEQAYADYGSEQVSTEEKDKEEVELDEAG